jgi:hypothetical protein
MQRSTVVEIVSVAVAGLVVGGVLIYAPAARSVSLKAARHVYQSSNFGEGIAAVSGALFGALSAFYLGRWQQVRDRRDSRHDAMLAAQFAIITQRNVLANISRQFLAPLRDDPKRHLDLPLYTPGGTPTFAPMEKLVFLAKSKAANLLMEIRVAEDSFRSAMDLLQARNEIKYRIDHAPGTVVHEFDESTGRSRITADRREVFVLRKVTDDIYERVTLAADRLEKVFVDLYTFGKKRFPRLDMLKAIPVTKSDEAPRATGA